MKDLSKVKRLRSEKGMTLIEIMVVITIIGIVATMFVVNVTGRMKKAKVKTASTQMAMIANQVEAFEVENGEYPQSLEQLVEEEYLKKVPNDPWNRAYVFAVPGPGGEDFVIQSNGPDKQEGNDDDIQFPEAE